MRDVFRHWLYRQPLYRASLRGRVPKQLGDIGLPSGRGDVERGRLLASGILPHGDRRIPMDGDFWTATSDDALLSGHLHGFAWLDDIAVTSDAEAWRRGRELLVSWLASQDRWQPLSWRADVLGTRLFHWLRHRQHLLTLDAEASGALLKSLSEQARHLLRVVDGMKSDAGAFAACRGLLTVGLVVPGMARCRDAALATLTMTIDRQVLADGGHMARSPAVQMTVLRQLVDIRGCLLAASIDVPQTLQNAIDRMAPMLRLWRHGDGRLALFNGSTEGDEAAIETLLADAVGPGRAILNAPHVGFQRLKAGRTSLIIDAGAPAQGRDETSHAGTLSFEMSVGRDRFVVNCGAAPIGDARWRKVLRATGAHSTLILDETGSMALDGGAEARRPRDVRAQRREIERNQLVETQHDGYAPSHSVIHHRDLYLAADGGDVRGEDRLIGGSGPIRYVIRFHLHPEVRASAAEGGSALLRVGRSGGWRFHAAGAVLRVEESVYFGDGRRRNARQIVLDGTHGGGDTTVKWRFARES